MATGKDMKARPTKRVGRKPKFVRYGKGPKREGVDMLSLCGTLTITVDPIAYQRESRGHD